MQPVPTPQAPAPPGPPGPQPMAQDGAPQPAAMPQEPPEIPVTLEQVMGLLRSQKARPFAMEIETDSTIQPDDEAVKTQRMEFVTTIGGFIQQAGGVLQVEPGAAPFIAELLKFAAGAFRPGREMEQTIETFAETISNKAKMAAQAGPPPNPEMEKIALEKQRSEMQMAMDAQKHEADMSMKQEEMAFKREEMALRQKDAEMARATEALKTMAAAESEKKRMAMDETKAAHEVLGREKDREMAMQERAGAETEAGDAQVLEAIAKSQEQVVKAIEGMSKDVVRAIQQLGIQENQKMMAEVVKSVTAPKRVMIERGPDGKAIGGTVGGE